jgi:hypothetical protein
LDSLDVPVVDTTVMHTEELALFLSQLCTDEIADFGDQIFLAVDTPSAGLGAVM